MQFFDRTEAGLLLSQALRPYQHKDAVVYALSRNGVPIALTIAEELNLPFGFIPVSRITSPIAPSESIGALTSSGDVLYDDTKQDSLKTGWLNWAIMFAKRDLERKRDLRASHMQVPATNKVAILVDDGANNGFVLRAALRALRYEQPHKVVVALPVVDQKALSALEDKVDAFVTLDRDDLTAHPTAGHYRLYHRLTDREVRGLMDQHDVFNRVMGMPA